MIARLLEQWRGALEQWRQEVPANSRPVDRNVPAFEWRTTFKSRIGVAAVFLGLWAIGVEAKLFNEQVLQHDRWVQSAKRQQSQTSPLQAKRGDIVDRKGRVLATSLDVDTIIAVPSAIGDQVATVNQLCAVFRDCSSADRAELVDRLKRNRYFANIRRFVSSDVAAKVAALKLDGIGFIKESHREYPNNELAAQVLGFAGADNRGLSGLELAYEPFIRGKDGVVLVQTDARGKAFYNRIERAPTSGSTVELTIDSFLQHVAERELRIGVAENRALGGTAIVMDPHTGEVLAMANEPTFDPNRYREATKVEWHNRAVEDLYEPGSTFKVVTASAAIQEKVMPVDTLIDVRGGRISIGPRVVRDTHDYGILSFTDVIVKSSNVGAIRIGFKLGTERLSDYVQKFGFGRPVSPDFPSESAGIVWERSKWTDSALASVSMGYQVGVTPLQMVTAVSSVANGGNYIEPRVVRAVYKDGRRLAVRPKILRQTVTPETAAAMTTIMEQVVDHGTGTPAKIQGYTIAGKTGTANKLANGRYSSDTFASFVGFLPSSAPVVTILVVLDSPRGQYGHFGGPVSAPIFKRIAEETLRYMGVAPNINPEAPILMVSDQSPDTHAPEIRKVDAVSEEVPGTVPDVTGMSAREATQRLASYGLSARVHGDGFVVAQNPPAGTPVEDGQVCNLTLNRAVARRNTRAPE